MSRVIAGGQQLRNSALIAENGEQLFYENNMDVFRVFKNGDSVEADDGKVFRANGGI